jgi:HlyD family secretion protein
MLRQVRGLGTLVPEEIRWIAAMTDGRVERILVQPGAVVTADTILMELSDPAVEQAAMEAQSQVKAAEHEYTSLRVRLERQLLDQQASAATVQADYSQAKLRAEVNEDLAKKGLLSDLELKVSRVRAEELATRNAIEQKRLSISSEEVKAQLSAQEAQLQQRRDLYQLRRSQVESLKVRPQMAGVVQQVPVQVGQQVTPGTNLARVANPERLKAELRIPETQIKDVQIGQAASIDTRNGIIAGRVIRIDPAAQSGTFTVDVGLEGQLPSSARPDLSVDGTVELERLNDVLYVGRPVHAQENSTIGLFKLEEAGAVASRVQVKLGKSSVSTVEVREGLREGDQVILSDTSQYDNTDRIRLN